MLLQEPPTGFSGLFRGIVGADVVLGAVDHTLGLEPLSSFVDTYTVARLAPIHPQVCLPVVECIVVDVVDSLPVSWLQVHDCTVHALRRLLPIDLQ